jgi:hypothetical protein
MLLKLHVLSIQLIPLQSVTVGGFLCKLPVSFLCGLRKSALVPTRFFVFICLAD